MIGLVVAFLLPVAAFRAYNAGAGEEPALPAAIMASPAASDAIPSARPSARPARKAARRARYAPPSHVSTQGFIWPVVGSHQITSSFGPRGDGFHHGTDIGCGLGQPIYAARGGYVRYAAEARSYGNVVLVDHGGSYQTLYSHLDRLDVGLGRYVATGQMLGVCGATGNASGPHLHFEVRYGGYVYDPLTFLP